MEPINVIAVFLNSINSLFFIFVGLLFFGIGLWGFLQEYNVTRWDVVTGAIFNSSVLQTHSSSSGIMYQADIGYNYIYKGNPYTGHCCGYSTSDQWGMEKLSRDHAPGSASEFFVNPSAPYQSRIKDEVNIFGIFGIGAIIFMVMGGFAALTGFVNLIAGFRKGSVAN